MKRYVAIAAMFFAWAQSDGQAYTFVGDSYSEGNNCYVITPNQEWQNGAVWYNDPIDLNDPFHLQFTMSFGSNPDGADGLVFVMQQVGNSVLGTAGGGMGFSGFSPSLGVEFDIFQNLDFGDPAFDHIALLRQGNVNHNSPNNIAGPIQASSTNGNIEDGLDHIVDIFWDPSGNLFSIWFDCVPRISVQVQLISNVFQNDPIVYWGFTGATGGFFNLLRVCLDPQILGLAGSYDACLGDDVQLQATGASGGTYSWEPAEFLDDPTISNPVATVTETTDFTVTYTDLCGTEEVQSTTVFIYDPMVDLGDDQTICEGESVLLEVESGFDEVLWSDGSTGNSIEVSESGTFGVSVTQGVCTAESEVNVSVNPLPEIEIPELVTICDGDTYEVDFSDLPFTFEWENGSTSPVRTFANPGEYSLTATQNNCSITVEFEIEITTLNSFDLGGDVSACAGESVVLDTGLDGVNVQWSTGATTPSISVNQSGTYWAATGGSDCNFSDTVEVTINPVPDIFIEGADEFCFGATSTLTASGADEFEWSIGLTTPQITIDVGGLYAVTGMFSATGCTSTASIRVRVETLPWIFLPPSALKCQGENITIRAESSGEVNWTHGPVGPSISVDSAGTYKAEVTNACGTSSAFIIVEDEECFYSLFIPNAFTPDGDGLNDLFRPVGERVKLFQMQIFDRLGNMVFETDNIDQAWNGSYRNGGYYCEAGVYPIKYKVEWENGDITEKLGHVNLIR
jgi:gliding motility-associated-like protein